MLEKLDSTDWTAIIIFSVLIIVTGIIVLALIISYNSRPSDFQRVQDFLHECQETTNWSLNECQQLWNGRMVIY